MAFDKIRQLMADVQNAISSSSKKDAIDKASSYVDSIDSDLAKLAEQNGIDIFASGQNFKNYLTSSTGVDESIFTKSIKELESLDLSGLTVEKQASQDNDDSAFYTMLDKIYDNEVFSRAIDANGDGKISDEEAKDFINAFKGMDSDSNNFSLDDIAVAIDKIAQQNKQDDPLSKMFDNFKNSFDNFADKMIEQIDNAKNQGPINLPTGGGIASNPYSSSQGTNANSNTQSTAETKTPEQTKEELETKIEELNEEMAGINNGTDSEVKAALEEQEAAKEQMEEQLKNDEKVDKKTKEDFMQLTGDIEVKEAEISEVESQISQTESDLTKGENTLSSLKQALDSLGEPEEDNEDAKAKFEERKSELNSQIEEQEKKNKKLEEKLNDPENGLLAKKETLEKEKSELETKKAQLQEKINKNCSDETKQAIENYENKKAAVEEVKTKRLNEVQTELKTTQEELKKVEDEIQTSENKKAQNTFDADFDEMLGHILGSEGGFSDHPADNGGATNYGITEETYRNYTGDPNADVRNITKEEVMDIYYKNYYQASGAQEYAENGDSAYAFAVFDAAVNHGVGAAKKMDSQAGGDVDKFMEIRKQKYISIVANNPSQQVFEKGWQNRWNSVYAFIDPNHSYENYIG